MKFVRVRVEFPAGPFSPLQSAMTDCDGFDRARLRFGGITATGPRTYVLSVTGDLAAIDDALEAAGGVLAHEVVHERGGRGLVYVRCEASDVELALQATFSQESLVTTTPIDLHPDGSVVVRVLGEPDDLQAAVAEAGERLSVTVERLADYDQPPQRVAAALTDRQEAAVRTALELGYYDVPRTATHDDVATELDCAPSTAGEHLRKAEAALVRSAFDRATAHGRTHR